MFSMVVLVFLLAILMISNVEYLSLKDPELFKRQPFLILVVAIILLIVVVAKPEVMLFLVGMAYMISGPVVSFLGWRKKRRQISDIPPQS